MNSFWQQMPFVRILAVFILGILWAEKYSLNLSILLFLLGLTILFIVIFERVNKKLTLDYISGLAYTILFLLLGSLTFAHHQGLQRLNHFSESNKPYLLVQLSENAQATKHGSKAICKVISGIDSLGSEQKVSGNLLLYFPALPKDSIPCYGQVLLILSGYQDFSEPSNPGGFDYKRYMAVKGVFHCQYLKKRNWVQTEYNNGQLFYFYVIRMQEFIQRVLKQYLPEGGDVAIAQALLFGYDKDIDQEVNLTYSRTGTLHVLAVSGMHVGMIFMLLNLFLQPLSNKKKGKFFAALIQLLGIWIYSVLCGFSPSILRATVMFSFVIIGKLIRRGNNPFNSLSASAFVLLLFDPMLIYQVGFQLSYAAVLGILAFYTPLYFLVTFSHKVFDEIWKIIAVSIAAQTLTLPLSIFYFHQFPNYFLPANLLIIPLTSLVIYLGIVLLLCSPVSMVATCLGKIIGFLIGFTNSIAGFFATLPGSCIEHLQWSELRIAVFYLSIICLAFYFYRRELVYIQSFLFLFLLQQVNEVYIRQRLQSQNKFLVYSMRESFCLDLLEGNQSTQLRQPQLQDSTEKKLNRIVEPNHILNRIENSRIIPIDTLNSYWEIKPGFHVFLLQQADVPKNVEVDVLVVFGRKFLPLKEIIQHNNIRQVVLSAGMSAGKRKYFKKILENYKIPCHDVFEKGAFEVSL